MPPDEFGNTAGRIARRTLDNRGGRRKKACLVAQGNADSGIADI
jgi:hypothetical protein